MQNRVFWWRRSTNAHAIQPAPRRATSIPISTPKSFKLSMGVGIIPQHSRKPQKSVVFQSNSLQGFRTQLNTTGIFSSLQLDTSCCHNAWHFSTCYCIATIRIVLPSDLFPTLQVLKFCIYAISHFASQRRIRLLVLPLLVFMLPLALIIKLTNMASRNSIIFFYHHHLGLRTSECVCILLASPHFCT